MQRSSALDAAVVTRRNLRDQLLDTWPDLADDSETLLDSLAGLDDFEEQCIATIRHALEREAYAKALGELIEGMTARKRRLEEGAKNLRLAVLGAMQDAGVARIKSPDMSLSTGYGKPKVLIVDEMAIPDDLVRISRTPNKAEIAKQIAAGVVVPGIELGNPVPFLSVHRS